MATTTEDLIIDAIHDALKSDVYTGEFLARKFWDLKCEEQANFFNALANICTNDILSLMQWCYMKQGLTKEGKQLLDNMKEKTDKQ